MAMTDTSNKSFLANNQFTDNDNKSSTTTSSSAAGTEPVAAPVPPVNDEYGSGSHTVGGTATDNKDPQEDGQNGNENKQPEPKPSEDLSSPSPNPEEPPVMPDVDTDEHEPDIWEPGHSDNPSDSDDFWEKNKNLLRQVQNILDFRYPSSNISLADIIAAACQFRGGLSGGEGEGADGEGYSPDADGGGKNTPPDADINKPEPDPQSIEDESIAKGFCKIYKTSLDELSKAVNGMLFDNYTYNFERKKPDDQKDIKDAVDIDKYNAEFDEQDKVRMVQLFKAVNTIVEKLRNDKPDDKFNEKTIIAPITDYCRTDETVVFNYISYLLKIFYDKWLLPDGSGDRFPYVIDGGDDVKRKQSISVIKKEWEKVKNDVTEIEKSYDNDKNKRTIKISDDSTAYIISRYFKYLTQSKYDKEKNNINNKIENATNEDEKKKLQKKLNQFIANYKGPADYIIDDKTYKAVYLGVEDDGDLFGVDKNNKKYYYQNERSDIKWFDKDGINEEFDLQLYYGGSTSSNCQAGKGSPQMMQKVADKLLDSYNGTSDELKEEFSKTYATVYSANNKNYRFKDYLHDLGIGMDCSGYVSRALAFIMTKLRVPGDVQMKTLGPGYGRLKSNATTLSSEKNSNLFLNTKSRPRVEDPTIWEGYIKEIVPKIKPGDIEMIGTTGNGFHIRIIYSVDEENMCFIDQQSGTQNAYLELEQEKSSLRFGVEETVVSKDKNLGGYLNNYRFARPYVFNDPERLKGFFIEMLNIKGQINNP